MTEEEARHKVCPTMWFCVNEAGVIQDRESAIHVQSMCIGSDRMAWRRDTYIVSGTRSPADGSRAYVDGQGHCGLAGQP